jgi:hypothetical protein
MTGKKKSGGLEELMRKPLVEQKINQHNTELIGNHT